MKNENIVSRASKVALLVLSLCHILSTPMDVFAKETEERPEVQTDIPVNITIDLEDEERFMGVDLYQIAEYKDGEFVYLTSYENLDIKSYQRLSRESEKLNMAETVAEYIEAEDIKADYSVSSAKGKMVAKDLPIGVYLVVQNDADFNATLNRAYVIEAPQWSADTNEYLYNIESYPKWEKQVWFSFRPEVVIPGLWILGLVITLAVCLFGPKVFRTAIYVSVSIVGGFLGMKLSYLVQDSFLINMVFFVCFAFFGLSIVFAINNVLLNPLKKMKLHSLWEKHQFWIVPTLGVIAFSWILYRVGVKNMIIIGLVAAALLVLSHWLGHRQKKDQIKFFTYDDLVFLHEREEEHA